jgi:hypothetical protein
MKMRRFASLVVREPSRVGPLACLLGASVLCFAPFCLLRS